MYYRSRVSEYIQRKREVSSNINHFRRWTERWISVLRGRRQVKRPNSGRPEDYGDAREQGEPVDTSQRKARKRFDHGRLQKEETLHR